MKNRGVNPSYNILSTILLVQLYEERKVIFNNEKKRIITVAANLIKNWKRCIWYENNVYPSKADSESGAELLF